MKIQLSKFLLIASVFLALPTFAQQDGLPELEARLAELTERLDLSEQQLEQLKPVIQSSTKQQQAILESYGIKLADAEAGSQRLGMRKAMSMKREMSALRQETRDSLEEILTEDQMAEFRLIQEERGAAMREKIRGRRQR